MQGIQNASHLVFYSPIEKLDNNWGLQICLVVEDEEVIEAFKNNKDMGN